MENELTHAKMLKPSYSCSKLWSSIHFLEGTNFALNELIWSGNLFILVQKWNCFVVCKEGLCLWLGLVQGACELVHFSIVRCSEKKVVHFCVRFKITNEHDQVLTMIRWQNRVRICRDIASFCIKLIDYSVTLILNYFRIAAGFYRKILFINLAGSMVVNSLMLLQITDVRTRTISRNVIQYCFPKLCWNNFSTFF